MLKLSAAIMDVRLLGVANIRKVGNATSRCDGRLGWTVRVGALYVRARRLRCPQPQPRSACGWLHAWEHPEGRGCAGRPRSRASTCAGEPARTSQTVTLGMAAPARHGLRARRQVFIRAENQHVYDRDKGTFRKYEEWILDTEGINLEQVGTGPRAAPRQAPQQDARSQSITQCEHLPSVPHPAVVLHEPSFSVGHRPQVLAFEGVDPQRTISNSIIEVLEVLGIEVRAPRGALACNVTWRCAIISGHACWATCHRTVLRALRAVKRCRLGVLQVLVEGGGSLTAVPPAPRRLARRCSRRSAT